MNQGFDQSSSERGRGNGEDIRGGSEERDVRKGEPQIVLVAVKRFSRVSDGRTPGSYVPAHGSTYRIISIILLDQLPVIQFYHVRQFPSVIFLPPSVPFSHA